MLHWTHRNFISGLIFVAIVHSPMSVFAQARRPSIHLHVFDYVGIPEGGLRRAFDYVRNVFDKIEVNIGWIDSMKEARGNAVEIENGSAISNAVEISVAIIDGSSSPAFRQVGPQVMGFTPKTGGQGSRVYIFYDHVQVFARASTVEAGGVGIPPVLGSAIAHEIGHVLLPGLETHSAAGIMQFRLGTAALKNVIAGRLTFTLAQADLIHSEIERRAIRFRPRAKS
jgi:hypothetical protein